MTRHGSTRRWRQLRDLVLARDGYVCQRPLPPDGHRCGRPATHAGHIIAAALGGTDDPGNLRAECAPCNLRDGNRLQRLITKGRHQHVQH